MKITKRQSLRYKILFVMFLLFPLIYYYFSPYLIIDAASQGIIAGSFIVFTLMFLSALFWGRLFCGWICPAAGLQRQCARINHKRFKSGKKDWVKYLVWLPWVVIIGLMLRQSGWVKSIQPFYQTWYGISIQNIYSLILFLIIAGLIALTAILAGRRGFCHMFCWMAPFMILGRKLRNLFGWKALSLATDKVKCTQCKTCTKNCPMSLDVHSLVQKENMEQAECILCGTCVDTCPQGVLSYTYKSNRKK